VYQPYRTFNAWRRIFLNLSHSFRYQKLYCQPIDLPKLGFSSVALGGSGGAAVILHYLGYGQPLRLWLEEEGVVSEASIKTK